MGIQTQFAVVQASQIYMMNPTISPKVAVVMPGVQGIDGLGGKKSSIKTTSFDSVGYEEYAPGLVDPGTPGGNIVFDYNNTTHQLLQKLLGLGTSSSTTFFYAAADAVFAPTVVAGVLTPAKSGGLPAAPVQTAPATAVSGGTVLIGTYFFKVTAINANGETLASNELSVTTTTNVSTVTVNWNTVVGATGYKVYASQSSGTELLVSTLGVVLTTTITSAGALVGTIAPPTQDTTGLFTRSGWLFDGFINEYSITAQVNNVVMAKFGMQATGARYLAVKGQNALI